MLPSIIEIADRAGLQYDPKSLNKKEVLYKCPFCHSDAHKKGVYKLSLNPEYNVYKCWHCGESGGVLQFESKLFDIPYKEVKEKYFKDRKYHPAEMLSPKQLKLISWEEAKRRSYEQFKRSLDIVLRDWKKHEREQRILAYAKLLIGANLPKDRQQAIFINIMEQGEVEGIQCLFSQVMHEYLLPEQERTEWTEEATELARGAWKAALRAHDQNHIIYLMMLFHLYKSKNQSVILNDNLKYGGM